jgi:hypothetical protein
MSEELKKRTWCWIMLPADYEIRCDLCKGANITWSEYENLIWCYDCEKDTPGTSGIFDGPIMVNTVQLMGISLDRFDCVNERRLYLHQTDSGIDWKPEPPE